MHDTGDQTSIKNPSALNYEPVSPSNMIVDGTAAESTTIDTSQVVDDQEYDFPAIGTIPVKIETITKDHENEEYDFPVPVATKKIQYDTTFSELGQNKSFLHLLPQSPSFQKHLKPLCNLPSKDSHISFNKVRSNFKPRVLFFQK